MGYCKEHEDCDCYSAERLRAVNGTLLSDVREMSQREERLRAAAEEVQAAFPLYPDCEYGETGWRALEHLDQALEEEK
jgi:hypothetical protein